MPTRRRALAAITGGLGTLVWPAEAADQVLRPDLEPLFASAGHSGCFALLDVGASRLTLVNPQRAAIRYVPASTFKIANSLIALETGVIRDENEIIPAGPGRKAMKAWEKDASIREGIITSHVPVYQELARRIGLARYRSWLARLDYGNRDPGSRIERFWLDGPLAISAIEQVRFLAGLAQGRLDMSSHSQALVRDIMRLETVGSTMLYGKTGWSKAHKPSLGWWVGFVEREGRLFAFALNITGSPIGEGARRLALGRALLSRLDVMG